MAALKGTEFTLTYDGKDISEDIAGYLKSITFEDTVEGESSSLDIVLENVDGLWSNGWWPKKGATLTASIDAVDCGTMEIDEIELSGPSDEVTIRALANIPTKKELKTKRSRAHEGKTIRQIAQTVAQANGLKIVGTIPDIIIQRVTQRRCSDLKFLRKISYEYGILFSVRDDKLVYTTIYDIDKREPSLSLDKTDLVRYSIKDKTSGVFKEVKIAHHKQSSRSVVRGGNSAVGVDTITNKDGVTYHPITSNDTLVVHRKVENQQQADAVAKAVLYRCNSTEQSGDVEAPGKSLGLAGNNVELCGLGVVGSGIYQIMKATHTLEVSQGWGMALGIKRISTIAKGKHRSIKTHIQPIRSNQAVGTTQQTNADGVGYKTIQ